MAANSGGVEWACVVKPIISSYGSFTKSDVIELSKAIIKRFVSESGQLGRGLALVLKRLA